MACRAVRGRSHLCCHRVVLRESKTFDLSLNRSDKCPMYNVLRALYRTSGYSWVPRAEGTPLARQTVNGPKPTRTCLGVWCPMLILLAYITRQWMRSTYLLGNDIDGRHCGISRGWMMDSNPFARANVSANFHFLYEDVGTTFEEKSPTCTVMGQCKPTSGSERHSSQSCVSSYSLTASAF